MFSGHVDSRSRSEMNFASEIVLIHLQRDKHNCVYVSHHRWLERDANYSRRFQECNSHFTVNHRPRWIIYICLLIEKRYRLISYKTSDYRGTNWIVPLKHFMVAVSHNNISVLIINWLNYCGPFHYRNWYYFDFGNFGSFMNIHRCYLSMCNWE